MTSKPEVSVYISVAHMVNGVTTIVHVRAYALDVSDRITLDDAQLAAEIAAKRFGLALTDRLGDVAEQYRVAAERE